MRTVHAACANEATNLNPSASATFMTVAIVGFSSGFSSFAICC